MKQRKKFLPVLLALCLLLSLLPQMMVSAADTPSEGLEFTPNEDGTGYVVSGIGSCKDTNILIPASYNGKPVVAIGSRAFSRNLDLISITIPEGVTSIGNNAFYFCDNLASITLPESLTSIGADAFNFCLSLTDITIPDNVTSIGDYAFYQCASLTSFDFPKGVTSIGEGTLMSCFNMRSITIPDGVTSIGYGAFMMCAYLESITIPGSVTSLGDELFGNCQELTDVYFDDTKAKWDLIEISNNNMNLFNATIHYREKEELAFTLNEDGVTYSVSGIGTCTDTNIAIPTSYNDLPVTGIADYAFYPNNHITNVTIPESVTTIGKAAFAECTGLQSVMIPDSVSNIGDGIFMNCTSLQSVSLPDCITQINKWTFAGCESLQSIDIPESVTSICEGAFLECYSLTNITLPEGVTEICATAFMNCIALTNITIPEGVTSIGMWTFAECYNLNSVTIPVSVTSIDELAFENAISLTDVYYGGTKEQWKLIEIEDNNDELHAATIHFAPCTHRYDSAFYWDWIPCAGGFEAIGHFRCALCGEGEKEISAEVSIIEETETHITYQAEATIEGKKLSAIKMDQVSYTLTVTNGSIVSGSSDVYHYNDLITVKAAAAEEGKFFAGWYLNGEKVSDSPSFKFYLKTDTEIEARYDDKHAEAAPVLSLEIEDRIDRADSKQQLKMIVRWELPSGYKPVEVGLVRSFNGEKQDELKLEKVDGTDVKKNFVAATRSTGSYTLNLTLSMASAVKNLYVVGYIKYIKPDGKENVAYTKVALSDAKVPAFG